jgi:hypothetical protein
MNPMQQRANNYVAKTFKLTAQTQPQQEEQNIIGQKLQAVIKARVRVLEMFGRR